MKNIFYGIVKKEYVIANNICWVNTPFYAYSYRCYVLERTKESIEEQIKSLKNREMNGIVQFEFRNEREKQIAVVDNSKSFEVGDKVKAEQKHGRIIRKFYDADENVMHYFTDIVVEKITPEDIEEVFNKECDNVIEELNEVLNELGGNHENDGERVKDNDNVSTKDNAKKYSYKLFICMLILSVFIGVSIAYELIKFLFN